MIEWKCHTHDVNHVDHVI
uniref:Uncharacterized protein n=1 Tax=Rhizophora mucronata TaxID=61149 RepID=A0A2P2PSJ8_RHIMU